MVRPASFRPKIKRSVGSTNRPGLTGAAINVAESLTAQQKTAILTSAANLATQTMPQLQSIARGLASAMKTPIGAAGLSLLPVQERTGVHQSDAVSSTSNSSTLWAYRKPRRKRANESILKYLAKRTVARDLSFFTPAGSTTGQNPIDIDLLCVEPVLGNGAGEGTTAPYNHITLRNAFDSVLLSKEVTGSVEKRYLKQLTSLHCDNLAVDQVFTNKHTGGLILEIYDCVPKFTIGPSVYVDGGETAEGYMSPQYCWQSGLSSSEIINLNENVASGTWGAKPTSSAMFNRTWNIVGMNRVNMTTGGVHRHRSVYEINKSVSYHEMAQVSTSGGRFAWTPCQMVVVRPYNAGESLASGDALNITTDIRFNYSNISGQGQRVIDYDSALA